ncbi:MAG: primosomal protein N' [Patescibacteria group bacterium]|nr:primosomal protein N' [Patescibacteria group bacterium]
MIAKIIPFTRLPYFVVSHQEKREVSFFDYQVPKELEEKIRLDQIVKIYFRNKKINGLVVGLKKTSKEKKLKPVEGIVFEESLITKDQLKLFKWLSSFYFASLPTILKTSLPQPVKRSTIDHNHCILQRESLKISKKFLPELKRIINIFITSKRKKFYLLWNEPFKKLAFYYAVIKKTITKKQKVLILLPEIDQINFFLKYLGQLTNRISILHSQLKKSEIWQNWQKIIRQEVDLVIGTRMAIFAPISNLGLIILEDEENDLHRSKQFPYYDTRLIAWKLTKLNKIKLIFSSPAPRVETYWQTFIQGKFFPLDLRDIRKTKMKLVDMVEEMRKGNFSPLSDDLKDRVIKTIKNNRRVIIYLKRKGFTTFNFCQDCGYLFSCPRCDLPLTAHKKNKIYYLLCHHCGYEEELPLKCPGCQGVEIKMKGLAIQKIEEILSSIGQVKSIDMGTKDRTLNKEIIITTLPFWRDFESKWMENIGLVGLINTDTLLNQPDFRSSEKVFQELVGIINWINYFKIPFIIQTWSKNNPAIENACLSDFKNFYQQELEVRKEFLYPPFQRFFRLTLQEERWQKLKRVSEDFEKNFAKIKNQNIKIFSYSIPPRRKKTFEKSYLIKIKNLHPLSPLPNEIKKILPQNSFLEPH